MPPNMSYCSTLNVHMCMSIEQRNIIDKKSCSLLFLIHICTSVNFLIYILSSSSDNVIHVLHIRCQSFKSQISFSTSVMKNHLGAQNWLLKADTIAIENFGTIYLLNEKLILCNSAMRLLSRKEIFFPAITLLKFLHSLKSIYHKSGITW